MQRSKPHQIEPISTAGGDAANGTHLFSVNTGVINGLVASAPLLLLPANSTSANVPAITPVGAIALIKA